MNMETIILQQAAQPQGPNPLINLAFFALIIFIMYWLLIRPQMKKAKEQRKFIENLREGDKIVTLGGIHGEIVKLYDNTLKLRTGDNTIITVDRAAVSLDFTKQAYPKTIEKKEKSK